MYNYIMHLHYNWWTLILIDSSIYPHSLTLTSTIHLKWTIINHHDTFFCYIICSAVCFVCLYVCLNIFPLDLSHTVQPRAFRFWPMIPHETNWKLFFFIYFLVSYCSFLCFFKNYLYVNWKITCGKKPKDGKKTILFSWTSKSREANWQKIMFDKISALCFCLSDCLSGY